MIEIAADKLLLLQRFFSGRNALKWDAIVADTAPIAWIEQVAPWIAQFASCESKVPLVLPVFDEHGSCVWYAGASDVNTAAALAEDLMGCVGPSYSDFQGLEFEEHPEDPLESAFRERFGQHVFCFKSVSQSACDSAAQAIVRYCQLLQRRPPVPDRTQQPFGKMRGEFDRALLAGNGPEAVRLLDEMIATGRIDAEQRQYLEIRRLAGLGLVSEISHNFSLLRSVVDLPLPSQTLTDVIDALYATYLSDAEPVADATSMVAAFHTAIGKQFGPLFQERKGVRHPSVLKAFLLYELSQSAPNLIRCDAIVAAAADADLAALLRRWAAAYFSSAPTPSEATILASAKQAMWDEDYAIAADLCFRVLPDKWAYSALLRCAVELADTGLAGRVVSVFATASEEIGIGLNERDQARLATLQAGEKLPTRPRADASWISWCETTVAGGHTVPPLVLLDRALALWQVEDYRNDFEQCVTLADMISNAQGPAERVFREAYPQLVDFFAIRPASPARAFVPLYGILIKLIAWNGAASADEMALTAEVVHALVSVGAGKGPYTEAIEDLGEILVANRAITNLDWALNMAEILALHVAPNQDARLGFFMKVVDLVIANVHRVSSGQRMVLGMLAKDFDCAELLSALPEAGAEQPELETAGDFDGLIGLYTLTESAGQRAKRMLQTLLPRARVELNSDHAATDRLRQLAANADVFVFAWKSSKHQAYYCAKDARGGRELLMPLGKGSASIIDSVFQELTRAL
jgi:hypothetical protein